MTSISSMVTKIIRSHHECEGGGGGWGGGGGGLKNPSRGSPFTKYKPSGNILRQYCSNSFWQYCRNIVAILDFACKLVLREF